jgi:putative transposase
LFDTKRGPKPVDESSPEDKLYGEIGWLKMQADGLKKTRSISRAERIGWIEPSHTDVSLTRQCELAGVARTTVYHRLETMVRQQHEKHEDDTPRALLNEEYTGRPFYGSRRMAVFLKGRGHRVNRKRVQLLMREMGLAGMAPVRPRASRSRSTRHIPTCCAAWRSRGQIRCGVQT